MSTPTQVVAKFRGVSSDVKAARTPALTAAAAQAKDVMLAAPGAPRGRVRGVGKRGARVGVKYTIRGNTAYVKWYGPAHLVNNPTKAHDIPRKRGPRAKKRVVVIDGHPYAKAHRGPTRGKQFFQKSKPNAEQQAKSAYYGQMSKPITDRFR